MEFKSTETPRTYIRRFRRKDEEKFIELLTNPEVTINLAFGDDIKTTSGSRDLLNMTISSYTSEKPL